MAETDSTSVDTNNEDDSFSGLPDEEIFRMVEDLLRFNEVLHTENSIFEKYLKRVEPTLVQGALLANAQTSSQIIEQPTRGRKRSKSRSSASEKSLKLNPEQKCEVAQREIEELRVEMNKYKENNEKFLDNNKAVIEEADIRLSEIKKMAYEFDRDIVRGSVSTRTGKVMAEKVMRHFDDNLKQRGAMIDKLRLKNSTLAVQRHKLKQQLKQKEEMGEVLLEVDFEQLKIENSQYLEKIEEKNSELLKLKLMAGNTQQVLNSHKKKMNQLTSESSRLKSEISQRQELMKKVEAETSLVEADRAKAAATNKKLRDYLSDYRVPEIIDYVNVMAEMHELKKRENIWDRKVDIAKMALNRHKKIWQQIRHGGLNAEV